MRFGSLWIFASISITTTAFDLPECAPSCHNMGGTPGCYGCPNWGEGVGAFQVGDAASLDFFVGSSAPATQPTKPPTAKSLKSSNSNAKCVAGAVVALLVVYVTV
ncbi:hypothetical protein Ae201684P_015386 [Aphanomyces euteiches]|nr:hypothetical protein Ae201684P_015386 [Aphanomyces euteiches]